MVVIGLFVRKHGKRRIPSLARERLRSTSDNERNRLHRVCRHPYSRDTLRRELPSLQHVCTREKRKRSATSWMYCQLSSMKTSAWIRRSMNSLVLWERRRVILTVWVRYDSTCFLRGCDRLVRESWSGSNRV